MTMYTFPQPVKYLDEEDNRIKFIDNSLVEPEASAFSRLFSDVAYENKSNSVKVSLPKKLASGILVAEDGRELRMTPVTQGNPDAVQKEVTFLDSAQTMVEYSDAFGENIHLQYAPVNDGVKENILLEEYTGRNEFQFTIDAPGLTPDVTEGPVIQLLDEETGEPVFLFKKAWAMDSYTGDGSEEETQAAPLPEAETVSSDAEPAAEPAASGVSEEELPGHSDADAASSENTAIDHDTSSISSAESTADPIPSDEPAADPATADEDHFEDDIDYRIESQGNGRYLLTMTINQDFLQDPDTLYPVLIDPYITHGYSEGNMPYTTVFSGTSTTWPSNAYEYIQLGYRSGYGEGIGYHSIHQPGEI